MDKITEQAKKFLTNGYKIFPLHPFDGTTCGCGDPNCNAAGKHPIQLSWNTVPLWSDDQVANMIEVGEFSSGYGVLAEKLLIVDIDVRNGGDEADLPEDLQSGFVIATGSGDGSTHHYFKIPEDIAVNKNVKEYPGIDFIAGSSFFVVGPYSKHKSGGEYRVVSGGIEEIETAPDWLIDIIRVKERIRIKDDDCGYIDATYEEVRECLFHIPVSDYDNDYHGWINIGMALHHALGDQGFDLWDDWSKQSEVYKSDVMDKKWQSFSSDKKNPITFATIKHKAIQNGWIEPVTFHDDTFELPDPDIKFKDFKPFKDDLKPVLNIPMEALPEDLRSYVKDGAARIGVAPDFILVSFLTIGSSIVGRKVILKAKQRSGWEIVINLWGAMVGAPSSKKSPAQNEVMQFIKDLEKEIDLKFIEEETEHLKKNGDLIMNVELAEDKIKKLKKELAAKEIDDILKDENSDTSDIAQDIAKLETYIEEKKEDIEEKPKKLRLTVNDITIEKLGVVIEENPNGLCITADELTGIIARVNKPENEHYRSFLLEGFNGNSSYDFDRMTRESVHLKHVVLSILGGIQPSKLKKLLDESIHGKSNDGFVQRFQLMVYPDNAAAPSKDVEPNLRVFVRLLASLQNIIDMPLQSEKKPCKVNFTPEAQKLFDQFERDNIEAAKAEPVPIIEEHISKYSNFVGSLALLLQLISDQNVGNVGAINTENAIKLCKYFESHARRIYGMSTDEYQAGRSLADHLHKLKGNSFTLSDFRNKDWSGLNNSEQRKDAIKQLIDRGYIAPGQNDDKKRYYKNPEIEKTENS